MIFNPFNPHNRKPNQFIPNQPQYLPGLDLDEDLDDSEEEYTEEETEFAEFEDLEDLDAGWEDIC